MATKASRGKKGAQKSPATEPAPDVSVLLDDASSEAILADPSDSAALVRLASALARLAGALGAQGASAPHAAAAAAVVASATAAAERASAASSDPAAELAAIRELLVRAVLTLRGETVPSAPAPSAAAATDPPAAATTAGETEAASPTVTTAPAPATQESAAAPQVIDDETIELTAEFLHEADELLATADSVLMNAERDGQDPEKINAIFRSFHTIKGVAGFLQLEDIARLAHTTENVLGRVREGALALRGPVVDLVFDATAAMRRLLAALRRAIETREPLPRAHGDDELLAALREAAAGNLPVEGVLPAVEPGAPLGDVIAKIAPVEEAAVSRALATQQESGRRFGEELVAQGAAEPKAVAQALRAQQRSRETVIRETVKVDLERVDALIEMIGELVIVESMVVGAPEITSIRSPQMRHCLAQLGKITRDLQNVGMRMRMVSVQALFQKMQRMVRDLAHKSGKNAILVTAGETTEMDRRMVEQVTDPLVHMIRNAVDHALEPPAARAAAGKLETGTIRLRAFHEGGSVVIEVADDGRGLSREAILAKAREKGLVRGGDELAEREVWDLLFLPGFSTALEVTDISGRGVGLDVVKRNVEAMRGRISVSTTPGQGTTFRLVLPLTLAIIDGTLVSCGADTYIIPTLSVVETIRPRADMLTAFAGRGELIDVRGSILPLLRLGDLVQAEDARRDPTQALVVVLEARSRRVGVLVDEVVNQHQVVVKTLGSALCRTPFVSGGAILADGRVGLILNVDEIGDHLAGHGSRFSASACLSAGEEFPCSTA